MTLGFTKFLGLCVDTLDLMCFEIPTSDFQPRSTQPTGSVCISPVWLGNRTYRVWRVPKLTLMVHSRSTPTYQQACEKEEKA